MIVYEKVLMVWALFAFPPKGALPVQYGPFQSEDSCKAAMSILRTKKMEDAICLPVAYDK